MTCRASLVTPAFILLVIGATSAPWETPFRAFPTAIPCPSSPHRNRFAVGGPPARLGLGRLRHLTAGLRRGPGWAALRACAVMALTDYGVVNISVFGPYMARLPTTGHTGADTAFQRVGGVHGCHPAHKMGTRGFKTRNRGGHARCCVEAHFRWASASFNCSKNSFSRTLNTWRIGVTV